MSKLQKAWLIGFTTLALSFLFIAAAVSMVAGAKDGHITLWPLVPLNGFGLLLLVNLRRSVRRPQ